MTLHRVELRKLAAEAIAARRKGYTVARDALHRLHRSITPEDMLELLDDAARVRPEPESIHPPAVSMRISAIGLEESKAAAALVKMRHEVGSLVLDDGEDT